MRSASKRSLVARRLFDAEAQGKLQLPSGLSPDERLSAAVELPIFTDDEREWLKSPDPIDRFAEELNESTRAAGRKLKVGFVQSALSRVGGIETWNRTLIRAISDSHVCGMALSIERANVASDGINVPVGVGLEAASLLAESVDILIVSNEFSLERILRHSRHRPKVLMVHHGDESCEHSRRAVLCQRNCIDHLVCVNPLVPALFENYFPCTHIPLTVDRGRCKPTISREVMRAEVGIPQRADVVLYSGRFSPEKRYLFARAIGESLPEGMFLVMMGGHDDAPHPRIRFVGQQSHPGNWYHAADIAISTSSSEGFGLSMLEILHVGLPLVATDRGIVASHPSIARVMSVESSAQEWVEAIVTDLDNTEATCERVEHAQALVESKYGLASFSARWESVIREVASAGSVVR